MKGTSTSKLSISIILIVVGAALCTSFVNEPNWGFFGHRKINRMAVFCLPIEMIQFYKKNIEYITEHSVDPDKRRYATRHEAVRHYIDIDAWGDNPFYDVPRIFEDALIKYSKFFFVNDGDTTQVNVAYDRDFVIASEGSKQITIDTDTLRQYFRTYIMPQYYEDVWVLDGKYSDSLFTGLAQGRSLVVEDHFSQEGILPYHLVMMYYQLVKAFRDEDTEKILRLSAEFGHYIGDAHVPLHTTRNYNGQLTDQVGIHAFWESRIPELFADKEYSYLVGKANKITNPSKFFWRIVKESHDLLDEVLDYEKELRKTFPEDQQLCYDKRLEVTIETQCPEFARAYQDKMNGMVERRMQESILSIGSTWYSAWIDAGQPDLNSLSKVEIKDEEIIFDPNVKTRDHSN